MQSLKIDRARRTAPRGVRGGRPSMASAQSLAWDSLLHSIRIRFPDLYRSWFEELDATLDVGEITVRVNDATRAAYLAEHCTQAFVRAAMEFTGHLVSVRFRGPDDGVIRASMPVNAAPPLTRARFNPDYTFEQFVVGATNRLAHAACTAVTTRLGTLYNPLFIHGRSGVGKTHLLQATCADVLRLDPSLTVAYMSCEEFINDFIRAIETGSLPQFREQARNTDVLVIDDIQFLATRESSQEELFHTFNALYQSRRQLILSADSPPSEIPTLEERLVSRFKWGLVAQIDPPNRETRQAILQKKARMRSCEIPEDVLDLIAQRVDGNVRLLEGTLIKLITEAQLAGRELTIETAQEFLPGTPPARRGPNVNDIVQFVSEYYDVKFAEIVGRKRTRTIAFPRQVAMYLARSLTPLSLEEIGAHFGGRDHSTVLHAERTVEALCKSDAAVKDAVAQLHSRLASGASSPT
ncbi:MAG: chromosomal replication initiator protein DnaA [Phycisphaerales bacterium]|nr:chromosomal replication initiator protein DnaA [Phycisphaerales bacterium]